MAENSYEYEERAAILEFDGGMSRLKAEEQARAEIAKRRENDQT